MLTALAVALAVVAIAAAIAIIVYAVKLSGSRLTEKQATTALSLAEGAVNQHLEQESRLEQVITDLKTEIAGLEKDLDACLDPAIVRERLRRMLSP